MSDPAPIRSAESPAHRELKRLALAWAQQRGLDRAAGEVRIARSPYRADVAAAGAGGARTAIFECKVSRADFLRDSTAELGLADAIAALQRRLAALRGMIGGHRPELRRGDELFAEFDAYEWQGLRHETHRRLARTLRMAERKHREGTKFARLVRWRSARELYLVTTGDVCTPTEIPAGWGWLEGTPDGLVERIPAARHELTAAEQARFVARLDSTVARRGGLALAEQGADLAQAFELRA